MNAGKSRVSAVPAQPESTREKILNAAEAVFAQRGFEGTSLRQLTTRADVNLASVNYHFGSKASLIQEVFRRRLDTLNQRRLQCLHDLSAQASLEHVLTAYVRPALELSGDSEAGSAFVRLLARAYVEHDDRLRAFLSEHYSDVLKQFAAALSARLPALDKPELYWRLDIVTGALTYAMSHFGMIRRPASTSKKQHRRQVEQHLVQFAAAGLRSA